MTPDQKRDLEDMLDMMLVYLHQHFAYVQEVMLIYRDDVGAVGAVGATQDPAGRLPLLDEARAVIQRVPSRGEWRQIPPPTACAICKWGIPLGYAQCPSCGRGTTNA